MPSVQQNYSINPERGFPGMIAEPNSPTRIEQGVLNVQSADTRANPRPGDSVYYDAANNSWRVARNAATQLLVGGILTYRGDTVAGSNSIVQFGDGDEIEIITMGVVFVTAGGATERGDILVMQSDDFKYDNTARVSAIANIHETPIVNFNRDAAADTNIIRAAIGYGRAI